MSEPCHFPSSWRWLDRPPLQLQPGLAGHVVVVLYWRLGCVHSRAALHEVVLATADLLGQAVAVIAVHVPTCAEEHDEARLRRVLAELPGSVTVAVASERGSLERLPTMWLLDAQGSLRVRSVGVPRRHRLHAAIEKLSAEAHDAGHHVSVPFVPLAAQPLAKATLAPTAIAAFGKRLWLASATYRRVFAFDLEGNVQLVVGSGERGMQDGAADQASFCLPVALCIHEAQLVVADAQSHTLRAIDRSSGDVTTLCGTGTLGADDLGGNYGRDQVLSSPSGIVSLDGGLYVSQAGVDQLWQVDPMTGSAMAWLGSGDGISAAATDGFGHAVAKEVISEPLGLAAHNYELWVVEGRGHKLSVVDLAHVESRVVQTGFVRPVAVAVHEQRILVADAWAGTVVAVSMVDGATTVLLGREHGLSEPVSLAVHGDQLFLADVGVDAVLVVDLSQEVLQTKRFSCAGLPSLPDAASRCIATGPSALLVEACLLREFSDVTLRIAAPDHPDGTQAIVAVADESVPLLAAGRYEVSAVAGGEVVLQLPMADTGQGSLRIRVQLAEATAHYVLPVVVAAQGAMEVTLRWPVDAKI